MPSRRAMSSALCLAAVFAMCFLDTGNAFALVHSGGNKNANNWRGKSDVPNKASLGVIGFGGGSMLPHTSRVEAGGTVRLTRVPSAMDHVELSRASSCPLRLHDVFGEPEKTLDEDQRGNCGEMTGLTADDTSTHGEANSLVGTLTRQEEEEEVKRGVKEGDKDEVEEEVQENKGLMGWVRKIAVRNSGTASTAAAPAAADAAAAAPEYVWPLPEVAAAEGGWEKGSREVFARFAEPGQDPSLEENERVIFCTRGWGWFPGKLP